MQHTRSPVGKVSLHEAVILAVVNVLRVLYFLTAGSFHKVEGGREIIVISQLVY